MSKYVSLKCPNCGATMEVDAKKKIRFCPYCGSADLIEESDEIKKAEIDKDIKIHQADVDAYKERLHEETERHKTFWETNSEWIWITLIIVILFSFMACV